MVRAVMWSVCVMVVVFPRVVTGSPGLFIPGLKPWVIIKANFVRRFAPCVCKRTEVRELAGLRFCSGPRVGALLGSQGWVSARFVGLKTWVIIKANVVRCV